MTQSGSGKQDEARRNRPEAVGRSANLAAEAFARAGFRDPSLVLRWREIVGGDVARFAQPLKLSESPAGGVLTVRAEPAAAVFLQHQSRSLCDRINAYLGRPAVARLRFVNGTILHREEPTHRPGVAAEPPGHDPARGFSGPDRLKAALVNLARARRRPSHD
jgi:hypothetical protein